MIKRKMNEQQMIDCLEAVWENVTCDKDREAYQQMLVLLDNMRYFLYYDLQIEYPVSHMEIDETNREEFIF